jgi:flagellar protein FlaJ
VRFTIWQRLAVWSTSFLVMAAGFLLLFLSGKYVPRMPYIVPLDAKVNTLLGFSILLGLLSPCVMEYLNLKWTRQIEGNIPLFLRDLSEYVRSGATLPRGIEEVSKRDYGPLTKEIKDVVNGIIFGETLDSSLMQMAQRNGLPQVMRMSTILVEARRSGGRVIDVLEGSTALFSDLDNFKRQRYAQMKPYSYLVYMAVGTFLIVSYVVLTQFLAPLCTATSSTTFLQGILDYGYYSSILFWASVMESLFGGFLAGKMSEGSLLAGTRHAILLLSITLIFFMTLGG